MMRIKALILDHDDTVVASSEAIHYPSFLETLHVLRPHDVPCTFEEFTSMCFHHGFLGLCKDIYKFNDAEMEVEYQIWKQNTSKTIPPFYPQMAQLLTEYKAMGGLIAVVSHSESKEISRDYLSHVGFLPDYIYGYDQNEAMRKPNPAPLLHFMNRYQLQKEDVMVVDDMKDGFFMAKACGVAFAAAGWSMQLEDMKSFFLDHADYFLVEPNQLWSIIEKDLTVL